MTWFPVSVLGLIKPLNLASLTSDCANREREREAGCLDPSVRLQLHKNGLSVKMSSSLLFLFSLLASEAGVEAKVVTGDLRTGENWQFLARFCFLSVHGRFQYEVEYEETYGVQECLLNGYTKLCFELLL